MTALLFAQIIGYVGVLVAVCFFIAVIVLIVAVNRNWPEGSQ